MDETILTPNPWMMAPFGVLLALIALAPLFFSDWWERHYGKVSLGLAAVVVGYYFLGLHAGPRVGAVAEEYMSFIALIGSLFVVSGGIHITVRGEATPWVNVIFLLVGAVVANVLGTTGASMLLIRPWLRMNHYRITGYHVVFFIFIIANVGGCLTPIGDPPLFLGYLNGIPFWWVAEACWPIWGLALAVLLTIFFVLDYRCYMKAPRAVREQLAEPPDTWRFEGLSNLFFLGVILVAVFISHPPFLREALMVAAAAGSYFTTQKQVHEMNHFTFHPIQEVAVLFVGIFGTMIPALDWLQANAGHFGNPTAALFFWSSGGLSSVLDNTPTYLSFFSALVGFAVPPDILHSLQHLVATHGAGLGALTGPHAESIRQAFAALKKYYGAGLAAGHIDAEKLKACYLISHASAGKLVVAISVGAVFFGANTYIGNGPNFMVKSIAVHHKVKTPTFLGYVFKYSLPIMLPMLLIVCWVFFWR